MIVLYGLLLFALALLHWIMGRRVASLEHKYTQAAVSADSLLRDSANRPGNSNKVDACLMAKRQFLLGQAVQKRDRLESKHDAWQARAEKVGTLVTAMRNWKGKKLPYTFGVLDVSFVLYLLDILGLGQYVTAQQLLQLAVTFFKE